uniref:DUF4283 domain-containing protein n=1 Tax=Brassica campestris TaxID=3711 RepID=A0A3P6BNU5_BRACM|nr:unnamed protein product [Brassica rapa]
MSERENENPWFSADRPSALIPPPTTAGSPLLRPPDPPDPPSAFANQFPSLQQTIASPPLSKKQISRGFGTASLAQVGSKSPTNSAPAPVQAQNSSPVTTDQAPETRSGLLLNASTSGSLDQFKGFTIHLPKKSHLPLPTNFASNNYSGLPPLNAQPTASPSSPSHNTTSQPQEKTTTPTQNHHTYAQKAKTGTSKLLQRLAPVSYSDTGIPQVTIPDEVFQRGADLHKDFIQAHFLAKMPSFQAIQSVLNFMWGKGSKLDIRTNPKERSFLVRIPNDFIRAKVLEKRFWYVGTAMFQVSKWHSSNHEPVAVSIPTSFPLWAHLKGLPLDLRSLEGLSFAAGLIGEPKETDEFTKNLTDLNLAHVKIEADFSKPLPALIELRRTNGEIIPVEVTYPWVPPTCSNCHSLGHNMKDCLTANPTWVEKNKPSPRVDPKAHTASASTKSPIVDTPPPPITTPPPFFPSPS